MSKSMHRILEAKLASLDGPEWDSSDEEEEEQDAVSSDKLDFITSEASEKENPTKTKTKRSTGSGGTKSSKSSAASPVIYIGHIPPNFEEDEITSFLNQFGPVKRMKLSRSKRTGRPKGYAFVEFDTIRSDGVETASIVAETLSGYLLMERRLVCHVLNTDEVHPKMFHGIGPKHNLRHLDMRKRHIERVELSEKMCTDPEMVKKRSKGWKKRREKNRRRLEELGIDYGFPAEPGAPSERSKKKGEEGLSSKDVEKVRKHGGSSTTEQSSKTKEKATPQKDRDELKTSQDFSVGVAAVSTPNKKRQKKTVAKAATDVKAKQVKSGKKKSRKSI